MTETQHTVTFDSVSVGNTVTVIDHTRRVRFPVRTTINADDLLLGAREQMPARVADCIDLALAIHTADRLSRRSQNQARHIRILLPVRCLDIFRSEPTVAKLMKLLHRYTRDNWSFQFIARAGYRHRAEIQEVWPIDISPARKEDVGLWSGGLDSLAGAYTRLKRVGDRHLVLFGTGSSTYVHGVQKRLARELDHLFPGRTTLIQLPIGSNGAPRQCKNAVMRSRGLVFMLLGAACAHLRAQTRLIVFENGIGAINLPFTPSEVGLDHTRAVHPISLAQVGELVSILLDTPFEMRLPFLFHTKAQLCAPLRGLPDANLIAASTSCDRRHRRERSQCGYCSSCLLRRQALAAAGIPDPTAYVITGSEVASRRRLHSDGDHLRAMLAQVDTLRYLLGSQPSQSSPQPPLWQLSEIASSVSRYYNMSTQTMVEKLESLYRRYVHEWDRVRLEVSQGLLESSQLKLDLTTPLDKEERTWRQTSLTPSIHEF